LFLFKILNEFCNADLRGWGGFYEFIRLIRVHPCPFLVNKFVWEQIHLTRPTDAKPYVRDECEAFVLPMFRTFAPFLLRFPVLEFNMGSGQQFDDRVRPE
jgi:hypothetical protein